MKVKIEREGKAMSGANNERTEEETRELKRRNKKGKVEIRKVKIERQGEVTSAFCPEVTTKSQKYLMFYSFVDIKRKQFYAGC